MDQVIIKGLYNHSTQQQNTTYSMLIYTGTL